MTYAWQHSSIPAVMNPEIDAKLAQEVAFFRKWGYLVIDDVLSAAEIGMLRSMVDVVYDRPHKSNVSAGGKAMNRINVNDVMIYSLFEEDERFVFLLDHAPVLRRVQALLGNCIQLHSAQARVTQPGEPEQRWHRDTPFPQDPDGTPVGAGFGQIACAYYLDPLTDENGPLCILPGSHKALFRPPESPVPFPDERRIYAQPGQIVMFDCYLFHRGCANSSNDRRRAVFVAYENAWMKPREPHTGPILSALRAKGTPTQRMLLNEVVSW